ncbi:MAG: trigger factor [Candidatus Adiutrix sp.]|jgi:trigger factor|nr:trigger factor [Candidatus Adiutrix sp.]
MMNVTIEEINSIKRKLTVELPEEEAQKARKKHLDIYARQARLKGFRPGKAPRDLVARMYAEELRREVLEELVNETVPKALEEHKLEPVGLPMLEDVTYEENKPFTFTVMVELKPQFASPQWKGLELQKQKGGVDDAAVEKKLEELRFSLGTVKKVEEDRALEAGDLANISYQGYDGDKALADMKAGPFNVELGRDRLTPEFEAALPGLKAGEVKDIEVQMPDDLEDKKMAGKKIVMKTTVHEIRKRELPELDDELAKDLGIDGVETLAALKDKIRKDLTKEASDRDDSRYNRQLTQILADLVTIDVPSAMVDREVSSKIENMRQNFGRNGMDFKKMGVDISMLRNRFRPQAAKSVTAALVLDQIARENNITISEEDIDRELAEMSEEYGQTAEVLREYYQSQNLMDNLREGLKIGKTLDMIKAEAKIVEVEQLDPAKLGYETAGEEAAEETAQADE